MAKSHQGQGAYGVQTRVHGAFLCVLTCLCAHVRGCLVCVHACEGPSGRAGVRVHMATGMYFAAIIGAVYSRQNQR